jgi:hypothetical protein
MIELILKAFTRDAKYNLRHVFLALLDCPKLLKIYLPVDLNNPYVRNSLIKTRIN